MPKKCNVYGCRGNYRGEPYTKVVPFPTDEDERNRWVDAIPNERSSLLKLKQIYACAHHFDCEWIAVKGGKRPSQPPSIFPGVSSSCLKQVTSVPRSTSNSAETRAKNEQLRALDKISDFQSFCTEVKDKLSKNHLIIQEADDIYIYRTDTKGRSVIRFLHFQHVKSAFGFLRLKHAEKDEKEIPNSYFSKAGYLQKNSLLSKWSQFEKVLLCTSEYEFSDADYLENTLALLNCMSCSDSHHYQFLYAQMQLLLTPPKGRRFDKNLYILAAELHNISPAAYRMLRNSGSVILPRVEQIKRLLHNSLHDENLRDLIQKLQPQQRLVNLLFDEVNQ